MPDRSAPALLALLLFAVPASRAQEKQEVPAFRSLQLVLLKANLDAPEIAEAEVTRLQGQHRAHLRRMGEEGKMLVAGPFDQQDDPTLRGLCLYDVGTVDEAKALAESDPAVKAGSLRVEVMTWWFHADRVSFPWADALAAKRPAEKPAADR